MLQRVIASFFISLTLFLQTAIAQFALPFGGAYDEDAKFHLGFFFNYTPSYYKLTLKSDFREYDPIFDGHHQLDGKSLSRVNSVPSFRGVGFGIPIDYQVNDLFDIVVRPTYSMFMLQYLDYHFTNGYGEEVVVPRYHRDPLEQSFGGSGPDYNFFAFELPLLLKYKSSAKKLGDVNTYKTFLIGGVRYTRYIGAKDYYSRLGEDYANLPERMPLTVKPQYFSYEIGVGFDLYFEYFKMSPEIRWSQSIQDLVERSENISNMGHNPYTSVIDRLLLRNINISISFQ